MGRNLIQGGKYTWSENNAKAVREEPAVYELYADDELIYIGSTGNLRERFAGYLSTNFEGDSCKKATKSYKREYTETESEARKKERTYLLEFQSQKKQLPKCNDVIPEG